MAKPAWMWLCQQQARTSIRGRVLQHKDGLPAGAVLTGADHEATPEPHIPHACLVPIQDPHSHEGDGVCTGLGSFLGQGPHSHSPVVGCRCQGAAVRGPADSVKRNLQIYSAHHAEDLCYNKSLSQKDKRDFPTWPMKNLACLWIDPSCPFKRYRAAW